MKVKACAKINLMLDILGKRENGYHDLYMLMQSVSLCDEVEVEKAQSIHVSCSAPGIPTDERNIAYKAAQAFFEATGIQGGADIHIQKIIPSQAGLAGGSADGAAVIVALDALYQTDMHYYEMCDIGAKVGADVPFCIVGKTRICRGIGDKMELIRPIEDCHIVIVKPHKDVSTAEAYAEYDKIGWRRKPDQKGIVRAINFSDLKETARLCENVFEQFIEVGERPAIKAVLRKYGALGSCMSGSGPSIFGIFDEQDKAQAAYDELKQSFEETFLCTPTYYGCKIVED
ncbi:MAG: 4-(cytidine 5'-diphospho)-2-C-methyl-D-erythritol kinase [Clostridia bacterium]|nr:4-(cytidine 5'-diphospho)-2-C-methyl-D-erythritol kinase [Clostridia bacterium]